MTELKEAIVLIQKGNSEREVARRLNMDRSTLRYNLKKQGIKSSYAQGKRPKNFVSSWFKNKTTSSYGYVLIKKRDHPLADKQGYVREHRLVMEKKLGRYLTKEETIHHRNEIKHDNKIENLFLFPNDKFHFTYHQHKKREVELTPEKFMEETWRH